MSLRPPPVYQGAFAVPGRGTGQLAMPGGLSVGPDLTSAFRFGKPASEFPASDHRLRYRTTVSGVHLAQRQVRDNPNPEPPKGHQKPPLVSGQ